MCSLPTAVDLTQVKFRWSPISALALRQAAATRGHLFMLGGQKAISVQGGSA